MSEINAKETFRGEEPPLYGPPRCSILSPIFFIGMMVVEIGTLAIEGAIAVAAQVGDYRVRCIDIIFPKKEQPDQKKEAP